MGPETTGHSRQPSAGVSAEGAVPRTPHALYHRGMKKLLLLALLAAIAAGIAYKVLTTEIPIDES